MSSRYDVSEFGCNISGRSLSVNENNTETVTIDVPLNDSLVLCLSGPVHITSFLSLSPDQTLLIVNCSILDISIPVFLPFILSFLCDIIN